jgi:hypothetical protein
LSRSERGASLAPAKAPRINEREFTRQAYEVKEAWKEMLRDYYRWQATSDEEIMRGWSAKVQRAKQKTLNLLGDQNFLRVAQKFDQAIASAQVTPADKEQFIKLMFPEWISAGVPAETITEWEQGVREAGPEAGRKAIVDAGGFAAYVRALVLGFTLELEVQASTTKSGRLRMKPLYACAVGAALCAAAMIALVAAVAAGSEEVEEFAILAAATCGAAVEVCRREGKKKRK